MTTITEIHNIAEFNALLNLPSPLNKDFEISRLEDLEQDKIDHVAPFRHHLFSVCLATGLDMDLNIGYYKRKPKIPFFLFKSPYQVMSWQVQPGIKEGWHFMMSQDFILRYPQLSNIIYEFPFLQLDKAIPFEIAEQETGRFSDIFSKIDEEYKNNDPDSFDIIASYIHVLLVHIRRLYDKSLVTEKELLIMAKESDLTLFNKFRDLLKEQIKEEKVLPENSRFAGYYADQLSVHPNYLNAVTKRVTGSTSLGIIHQQIISLAKIMLLHTELSIKEIAFRLSFSEPTHFGSFFKKYTDQTPSEFRREIQSES